MQATDKTIVSDLSGASMVTAGTGSMQPITQPPANQQQKPKQFKHQRHLNVAPHTNKSLSKTKGVSTPTAATGATRESWVVLSVRRKPISNDWGPKTSPLIIVALLKSLNNGDKTNIMTGPLVMVTTSRPDDYIHTLPTSARLWIPTSALMFTSLLPMMTVS
jgi:hypothetical protein